MRPVRRRSVLATLATGLVAGCASPRPNLYALDVVPGVARSRGPSVILVREMSLPKYLDRAPIVRSSANYRLDVYPNDWWGELPGTMFTRILAGDLALRLPRSTVLPEAVSLTVNPDLSVEVSIQRFDEDAGGTLLLAAAYALPGPRGTPPPHDFRTIVTPAAAGAAGQVAAMSVALGRLADAIAARIAARPSGRRR